MRLAATLPVRRQRSTHFTAVDSLTPKRRPADRAEEYRRKLKAGYRALELMDRHLQGQDYLVGDRLTIADISLFAYTHVAHEGGFDLAPYGALGAWLERVAAEPGFVAMPPAAER